MDIPDEQIQYDPSLKYQPQDSVMFTQKLPNRKRLAVAVDLQAPNSKVSRRKLSSSEPPLDQEIVDLEENTIFSYSSPTSNDFMTEDEFKIYLQDQQKPRQNSGNSFRTQPIHVKESLESFRTENMQLRVGKVVELSSGDFLRIRKIKQDPCTTEVFLKGSQFRRWKDMNRLLPLYLNEVCWVIERIENSLQNEDGDVEVPLAEVRKLRRIIFTNYQYPQFSTKTRPNKFYDKQDRFEKEALVCRIKLITIYQDDASKTRNNVKRKLFVALTPEEAHPTCRKSRELLRYEWRGQAAQGGVSPNIATCSSPVIHLDDDSLDGEDNCSESASSCTLPMSPRSLSPLPDIEIVSRSESPVDLTDDTIPVTKLAEMTVNGTTFRNPSAEIPRFQYTFGDAFCGAGGTSRGALQAGLRVLWGFDFNIEAIRSFSLNFPDALCEHVPVDWFLAFEAAKYVVDILHLSPPCQPFSPAHTIASDHDESNEAALFAIGGLLDMTKPRIVTMEETAGLIDRHPNFFHSVIREFVSHGYSVSWQRINCMLYGVPQARKRLVIVAAGWVPPHPSYSVHAWELTLTSRPGEIMPPFPKPTHGTTEGLMPLNTIGSMVLNIPPNASHNEITTTYDPPKQPYAYDQLLKSCVTTGGGVDNYHPSGERQFTNREFACLQTFPLEHQFGNRQVKKQIGNAVPPMLSKAVMIEIVKSLKKDDGLNG
ncbi:MAG: hypothetical protein M1834_007417 [Cirrosporium novae-zelandiae]|nr:MAG: hypothetical protein M1834_007417 [Cirrosporium novae-zelandiae]